MQAGAPKDSIVDKLSRFAAAAVKRLRPYQVLMLLGVATGLATGSMALVLKSAVHAIDNLVLSLSGLVPLNLPVLISPAVGIFLTVLLVRYLVKEDIGHGLSMVLRSIAVGRGNMPAHASWSFIAGCSLTSGFGGSVGMEAPIVATGAGIGSGIGRVFGLGTKEKVVLIGCGAAAAVGAIFKAPIAGLILALEVLAIDSTAFAILPILIASVSGALISMIISDRLVEFSFVVYQDFSFSHLPAYVILGLLCGFVSVMMSRLSYFVEEKFRPLKPRSRFAFGVLGVGLLVFAFPPLFGEGYEAMKQTLSALPEGMFRNGVWDTLISPAGPFGATGSAWVFVAVLLITVVVKCFAMAMTTAAGGVGGIFAPSLFLGCVSGFAFARILNLSGLPGLLGIPAIPEHDFALVGMAGVLAGVMHAPLTAIFLIAEITGGYKLFIPLMLVVAVAFYTTKRFEQHSMYARKLAKSGELVTRDKDKSALSLLRLDRFIRKDAPVIDLATKLDKIVALISRTRSELFAVVNPKGDFCGFVFVDEIRQIMFVDASYAIVAAADLIDTDAVRAGPGMTVDLVMDMFHKLHQGKESAEILADRSQYMAVVNEQGTYLGFVHHSEILEAYRQKIIDISNQGES